MSKRIFKVEQVGAGLLSISITTKVVPDTHKLGEYEYDSFGSAKEEAMGRLTVEIDFLRVKRNRIWNTTRADLTRAKARKKGAA